MAEHFQKWNSSHDLGKLSMTPYNAMFDLIYFCLVLVFGRLDGANLFGMIYNLVLYFGCCSMFLLKSIDVQSELDNGWMAALGVI